MWILFAFILNKPGIKDTYEIIKEFGTLTKYLMIYIKELWLFFLGVIIVLWQFYKVCLFWRYTWKYFQQKWYDILDLLQNNPLGEGWRGIVKTRLAMNWELLKLEFGYMRIHYSLLFFYGLEIFHNEKVSLVLVLLLFNKQYTPRKQLLGTSVSKAFEKYCQIAFHKGCSPTGSGRECWGYNIFNEYIIAWVNVEACISQFSMPLEKLMAHFMGYFGLVVTAHLVALYLNSGGEIKE